MKQYLLSMYQPTGPDPRAGGARPGHGEARRHPGGTGQSGLWVFAGGLHAPGTATVLRPKDGDVLVTDGPFARARSTSAASRSSRRPTWTPRWPGADGTRGVTGLPIEVRPLRMARGLTVPDGLGRRGDRTRLPRRVRARGRGADPRLRRPRHRRGRGAGRVHRRGPSAGPPTGCRPARRAGSSPPPATGPSTACAGRRPATTARRRRRSGGQLRRQRGSPGSREERRGGTRARRPAAADLHLLPSGAGPRRAGGADPAPARRPQHGGDRPRLPGPRADDGAAAGPGQGQDPRRADPVPGPGRGRPARPAARRTGRRLPDLQRGIHRPARATCCPAPSCAPRRSVSGGCWPSSCRTSPRCSGCWR